MKTLKAKPLNNAGFAHFIVPVLVIVAIGGIGTYLFTTSHADALASCSIVGMPKKSSTIPTQPSIKITNSGTTSFTPTLTVDTGTSDGQGHGRGGSSTLTLGKVAPNATRKFTLVDNTGNTVWNTNDLQYIVTATSTDPSFTCTATTQKTTSAVVNYLASIITKLEQNTSNVAKVTASPVTVPGPIGDAQARPLVFALSGTTYYAYSQGTAPDFSGTPLGLANSMAIVSLTDTPPTKVAAYLDKSNNLVDANGASVGFSTGGN